MKKSVNLGIMKGVIMNNEKQTLQAIYMPNIICPECNYVMHNYRDKHMAYSYCAVSGCLMYMKKWKAPKIELESYQETPKEQGD